MVLNISTAWGFTWDCGYAGAARVSAWDVLRRNAPNTPQTEIPGGPTAANAPRAETQTAPFIVQKPLALTEPGALADAAACKLGPLSSIAA